MYATLSIQGNCYILVTQSYFMKWLEAIAWEIKRQTCFQRKCHNCYIQTQGICNFESTLLFSTLKTFGVEKIRMTAYHPQGDGMVERANGSILHKLCACLWSESRLGKVASINGCSMHTYCRIAGKQAEK